MVALFARVDKGLVIDRLHAGTISGCGQAVPPLTDDLVRDTPQIVAQMGPQPFIQAMQQNPDFDIIVGGRAYDPSPYIAYSEICHQKFKGVSSKAEDPVIWGGFAHMGKIMECGGLCATPKSQGAVATVFSGGSFEITPTDLSARCTPTSVAAHALYENSRPDLHFGPGGHLDSARTEYEQLLDGRTTRVRGGEFISAAGKNESYTVKLEGARSVGYRSMFVGAMRDRGLLLELCYAPFELTTIKPFSSARLKTSWKE